MKLEQPKKYETDLEELVEGNRMERKEAAVVSIVGHLPQEAKVPENIVQMQFQD